MTAQEGYEYGLGRELARAFARKLEAEARHAEALMRGYEQHHILTLEREVSRAGTVIDRLREQIMEETGSRIMRAMEHLGA